jgi:hypothetical protein
MLNGILIMLPKEDLLVIIILRMAMLSGQLFIIIKQKKAIKEKMIPIRFKEEKKLIKKEKA